jgi:hypothetical protein
VNLKTIADALATRFASVTATNGSETETATATADLPDQVSTLALLVYPPTGDLSLSMGRVLDAYDFPVRLLRDPLSTPARTRWLYAWANALRPLVHQQFTLGVTGVTQAEAVGMRVAIDGQRYAAPQGTAGGDPFDVVEVIVRVQVFEVATGVAP